MATYSGHGDSCRGHLRGGGRRLQRREHETECRGHLGASSGSSQEPMAAVVAVMARNGANHGVHPIDGTSAPDRRRESRRSSGRPPQLGVCCRQCAPIAACTAIIGAGLALGQPPSVVAQGFTIRESCRSSSAMSLRACPSRAVSSGLASPWVNCRASCKVSSSSKVRLSSSLCTAPATWRMYAEGLDPEHPAQTVRSCPAAA